MSQQILVNHKSDYPDFSSIEKSFKKIDTNSPFADLIKASMNQIKLHERNKVISNSEKDFIISIETDLTPGRVSLAQLGTVANGIQRIFTTLINDVIGKGNIKGIIPKHIVDTSNLIVAGTSPGSFNIHISKIGDSFVNELIVEEQLGKIHYVFERLKSEDPSFIIEDIGLRTFTVAKHWFKQLEKDEISFSIINDSEEVKIDKARLKEIAHNFNNIKSKVVSEKIEVIGEVDSANRSSNSMRIIMDNGKYINTNIEHELFEKGIVIGKKYVFKLTKIIVNNISTGQSKDTFKTDEIIDIN